MKRLQNLSLTHQFVGASVLLSTAMILLLASFVATRSADMMVERMQESLRAQVKGVAELMESAYELSQVRPNGFRQP